MLNLRKKHGFYQIFNSRLCSQELTWTVPITDIKYAARIRITARHSPFVERWLPVSAGRSTGTPSTLHCCLPALPCAGVHWTGKLAYNSLDLNPVNYSVYSVATDGVSSRNLRRWPGEMGANRLLGSAEPKHIEPSDQYKLPNRLIMVIKAKDAHIEFRLD